MPHVASSWGRPGPRRAPSRTTTNPTPETRNPAKLFTFYTGALGARQVDQRPTRTPKTPLNGLSNTRQWLNTARGRPSLS